MSDLETALKNAPWWAIQGPFVAIIFGLLVYAIFITIRTYQNVRKAEQFQQNRIDVLEKKAADEPEKVRFAWDLARVKLEAYFDRNLTQVKAIFYVAVGVMLVGFCFILWGLRAAVLNPDHVKVAVIASASGVITEFISLSFMIIYRSTMLQASRFMRILERINTVGMAVQILDSMKDSSSELKDLTRVDIIRLLLAKEGTQLSLKARSRRSKPENPVDPNGGN